MPGTVVEAGAVVDKAIIGEDCTIHSGAVVHKKTGPSPYWAVMAK